MKIKCTIHYPWAGIPDDEETIEIDGDMSEMEKEEFANEILNDMVWNTLSSTWEEIE